MAKAKPMQKENNNLRINHIQFKTNTDKLYATVSFYDRADNIHPWKTEWCAFGIDERKLLPTSSLRITWPYSSYMHR